MSALPNPELPDDWCPYRKPFPAGFDECPAFQPTDFMALDTQYQVLGSVRTCTHLEVGSTAARQTGFYPRCRLGGPAERERWVREVRESRLSQLTAFRVAYGAFAAPHMEVLWGAKGRQLEALRGGDRTLQAVRRRELEELAAAFQAQLALFLAEHEELLKQLGLPVAASIGLFKAAFDHWIASSSGASDYEVPEEILAGFPAEARILLRPREAP